MSAPTGNIKLIVIGASTGGIVALEAVLNQLPPSAPPVVVAIHLKQGVAKIFADGLNGRLPLDVKEAKSGDTLANGQVLIAPGGKHTRILSRRGMYTVECFSGEKLHGVAPAADILFESAMQVAGPNAIGVILTGIGLDGAAGLLKMRQADAVTIGQDEDTCVVYGMPKVAYNIGAVKHQLPLNQIGKKIVSLL